jgi:hypothetical protein
MDARCCRQQSLFFRLSMAHVGPGLHGDTVASDRSANKL